MKKIEKQKLIAIALMLIGTVGFFVSMSLLDVWGKTVDQDPITTLKAFFGISFLALGLGGGLGYLTGGGAKAALKIFLAVILIFIAAGIFGKLLRLFIPSETLQPFAKLIGIIAMIYGIQWAVNKSGLKKT